MQGRLWAGLEDRGNVALHCSALPHLFTPEKEVSAASHIDEYLPLLISLAISR